MPVIQVLIFRGTGGVFQPEHPRHSEPALVRAGHVGVKGVIEGKIIGFHPTPEAAEALGSERELLKALGDKQPQPGRLQDDDAYFERAAELVATANERTTVYFYEVEISDETLQSIRSWYTEQREALYNFPERDGSFKASESNCAVFWLEWFKIPLPLKTGSIRTLVEEMEKEGYDKWSRD